MIQAGCKDGFLSPTSSLETPRGGMCRFAWCRKAIQVFWEDVLRGGWWPPREALCAGGHHNLLRADDAQVPAASHSLLAPAFPPGQGSPFPTEAA